MTIDRINNGLCAVAYLLCGGIGGGLIALDEPALGASLIVIGLTLAVLAWTVAHVRTIEASDEHLRNDLGRCRLNELTLLSQLRDMRHQRDEVIAANTGLVKAQRSPGVDVDLREPTAAELADIKAGVAHLFTGGAWAGDRP